LKIHKSDLEIQISETLLSDWMWDGLKIKDSYYFLTAHNKLIKTDTELQVISVQGCEEKCILYSGVLLPPGEQDGVCVLAGSVFSQVLIWRSRLDLGDSRVLHRLYGHEGVIFSLNYDWKRHVICSTSDDRSARVWGVKFADEAKTWDTAEISLKHKLYGHTARVFRSLIMDSSLITVGEDSKICVWNLESGNLDRTITDAHCGSPIWSLCMLGADVLVTGGGNSAVSTWNLQNNSSEELFCDIEPEDSPKLVKFINNKIFVLTNLGKLICHQNRQITNINVPGLQSYAVISSNSQDHILLASLAGDVTIISSHDYGILFRSSVIRAKIFAAELFETDFLVNGPDGRLVLARFDGAADEAQVVCEGLLPECKQRWFSVARVLGDRLIVGDRVGSVHVYGRQNLVLKTSFKKLHGRNGVTDIVTESGGFMSCGRDGAVRRFGLSVAGVVLLSCIHTGTDWTAGLVKGPGLRTVSFHGNKMILKDILKNHVLSEVECGGGHRSWDLHEEAGLVYIKDRRIHLHQLNLQGDLPAFPGSHATQINVVESFRLRGATYFCTGGEDTMIRIHKFNQKQASLVPSMVLRGHVSSIKCLGTVDHDGKPHLVSGGGRAQLKVWRLLETEDGVVGTAVADMMLLGSDSAVKQPWRKAQSKMRHDPETRFLSLEILGQDNSLFIYVGCSDSVLRIFVYTEGSLNLYREIEFQDHCILKVKRFSVLGHSYLLSSTTGGSLFVWRTDGILSEHHQQFQLHQSGVNCVDAREADGSCLLLTGGDDNALVVSRLEHEDEAVIHTILWRADRAHSAQITGVHILGDLLYSVSIDQRICCWRNEPGSSNYIPHKVKCSNVSDIQTSLVTEVARTNVMVCVGIGLEVFSL